jgi:3-hydroxyacyl-CoA dehydrogenase
MSAPDPQEPPQHHITLIGLGAIGISFLALHLKHTSATISIYDTRPDLAEHIAAVLPGYLSSSDPSAPAPPPLTTGRLKICTSLHEACAGASIIQEQGPERLEFKQHIWAQIAPLVPESTHLWSSTSGIAASHQGAGQRESVRARLLVVHPFNPPHIMPLIEIVPSRDTSSAEVAFAKTYFEEMGSGHRPVVLHKEMPGFVGNRLAFVLLREACYLVQEGVVSVRDLDTIVEASLGPRWAVNGPFKSYNAAGSAGGIGAWLENLKATMQEIWDGSGKMVVDGEGVGEWKEDVIRQTGEAYGVPGPEQYAIRDKALREVLKVQEGIPGMVKGKRAEES